MADRRMFRYEIPIDDRPHTVDLDSDPVAVAATGSGFGVEFWAERAGMGLAHDRTFQVFGTGHLLPDAAKWAGTCPRTEDGFVWHLYDITGVTG